MNDFEFAAQPAELIDPATLAAFARLAESLGYDEVYSSDHIGSPDPHLVLAEAAATTERVRLGPLVLNTELYNPVTLARSLATFHQLCGGRSIAGLGTGYASGEHHAIGTELRPPGPRVERFGEVLDVLGKLVRNEPVKFEGTHVTVEIDGLGVSFDGPPPRLLIGGNGNQVVRLGARHADVFQFLGLSHDAAGQLLPTGFDRAHIEERCRLLDEAAEPRDQPPIKSVLVQACYVGNEPGPVIDHIRNSFGMTPELIAETPFILAGSLEQIIDKIERFRQTCGISHWVVREPEMFAPVVQQLARR